MLGIANVTASSRIQPKITETTTTAMYIPTAAARRVVRLLGHVGRRVEPGDRVLGEQQAEPEHEPERRVREVVVRVAVARGVHRLREHVAENDWWWSGTMISTRTMNATPTMCQ